MLFLSEDCPARRGTKISDSSEKAEASYNNFRRETSTNWVRANVTGKIAGRKLYIFDFGTMQAISEDEAYRQLKRDYPIGAVSRR